MPDDQRARLLGELARQPSTPPVAPVSPPVNVTPSPAHVALAGRVALVLGNSAYKTRPLRNPTNDARAIAAAFRQIGFQVVDGYDLDYASMRRVISDFLIKVSAARVAVVYYAGHGVQLDGRNYLVPIDAKLEDKRTAGLELLDMDQDCLAPLDDPGRSNIVFLDACRNNPFVSQTATTRSTDVPSGLSGYTNVSSGMYIAFATAPGKVCGGWSVGAHSPFTAALLRNVPTRRSRWPTCSGAVRKEVMNETNGKQIPWVQESLVGDVYMVDERDRSHRKQRRSQVALFGAANQRAPGALCPGSSRSRLKDGRHASPFFFVALARLWRRAFCWASDLRCMRKRPAVPSPFDPPDTDIALAADGIDPATLATLPVAPQFRAYIPSVGRSLVPHAVTRRSREVGVLQCLGGCLRSAQLLFKLARESRSAIVDKPSEPQLRLPSRATDPKKAACQGGSSLDALVEVLKSGALSLRGISLSRFGLRHAAPPNIVATAHGLPAFADFGCSNLHKSTTSKARWPSRILWSSNLKSTCWFQNHRGDGVFNEIVADRSSESWHAMTLVGYDEPETGLPVDKFLG